MTVGFSPGLFSSLTYASSSKGYSFLNQRDAIASWDEEGEVVGEELKENMRDYTRTLSLTIFTDDTVNQQNGISIHPELKDENGNIPVINYTPSAEDIAKRDSLAVIAADILRAAGATTVIRSNWPPGVFIHIMSTMRMGYVTDINCEALQVKRLFIADNSVLFNGLGGPNPTLTTQALATRTAQKIVLLYFS